MPSDPGEQVAYRVSIVDTPPDYDQLIGCQFWMGEPLAISEASGDPGPGTTGPTFQAAVKSDEPYFDEWAVDELVHLSGQHIIPGVTYEIQAFAETCVRSLESSYSAPLSITTSQWGDIGKDCSTNPCGPPDLDADFDDIAMVVDKFRNLPGSPIKVRADLAPAEPDQVIDFVDIPAVVDGFRGLSYPYSVPTCP
jgi:hypothetical protein